MKHRLGLQQDYLKWVAPFTGAWIETYRSKEPNIAFDVAPFTGAWIETALSKHPAFVELVAPFTGAWIETFMSAYQTARTSRSLPSRERGLKLVTHEHKDHSRAMSLPSRERGLKQ